MLFRSRRSTTTCLIPQNQRRQLGRAANQPTDVASVSHLDDLATCWTSEKKGEGKREGERRGEPPSSPQSASRNRIGEAARRPRSQATSQGSKLAASTSPLEPPSAPEAFPAKPAESDFSAPHFSIVKGAAHLDAVKDVLAAGSLQVDVAGVGHGLLVDREKELRQDDNLVSRDLELPDRLSDENLRRAVRVDLGDDQQHARRVEVSESVRRRC